MAFLRVSKQVIALMLISTVGICSDLYCQTGKSEKSQIRMKIAKLPENMKIFIDTLPQLNAGRAPASEQMDKIMDSYFENKRSFAFSVKVGDSEFDEIQVKPLLTGEFEGKKAVAFMTNPFAPEKFIKFQYHMSNNEGSLDYKGSNGTHNQIKMNCFSEKPEGF